MRAAKMVNMEKFIESARRYRHRVSIWKLHYMSCQPPNAPKVCQSPNVFWGNVSRIWINKCADKTTAMGCQLVRDGG